MKKVLLSLISLLFIFNISFVNAEEIEVINNEDNEATEVLESNNDEAIENDETILKNKNEVAGVKTYVAELNGVNYETLDEAISAAKDNDTITLLSNANTSGINLSKNLIIDGGNNTITFNNKGIALWGKALTFKNAKVVMNEVLSTPYTAEWGWMTISASTNASLTLENTTMTLDANNKGNSHAIYFSGNNKLILNNSKLEIKNYKQDALEWNGEVPGHANFSSGYNVTLNNSTYISDNNRSGFTGTFTVKANNSKIEVINSTGNGSNGSHFEILNNSIVKFNNNNAHGLSAGLLTIDNSTVEANNNGANGVHVGSKLTVKNNSTLLIDGNKCTISSKWTQPGALYIGGKDSIIEKSTKLTITNNNGSGIYVKKNASLNLEVGTITNNIAEKLTIGGGINNNGTLIMNSDVIINNNHAESEADDIYNAEGATITISNPNVDTKLEETRKDGKKLNDCTDKIDNWYDDSKNNRWNAHGKTEEKVHVEEVDSKTFEGVLSIKAAHNIYSNVIAKYVDKDGKEISEEVITNGKYKNEYQTFEKEIQYYELIEVKGETKGTYGLNDIVVTYIYEYVGGTGGDDPEFPKTGIESNSLIEIMTVVSFIALGTTVILKKKLM